MANEPKYTTGFGIEQKDAERGYLKPKNEYKPEQDVENYKSWYTLDKREDIEFPTGLGGKVHVPDQLQKEWEFRDKHRESEGFLTRNPLERY